MYFNDTEKANLKPEKFSEKGNLSLDFWSLPDYSICQEPKKDFNKEEWFYEW